MLTRRCGRLRGALCLVTLALAAIAGSGCSKSGGAGGGDYNFNGVWEQVWTLVEGTKHYTVGSTGRNQASIAQNGTSIVVTFPGRSALTGGCDPAAGTFSVTGADPPKSYRVDGRSVDESSMSGEEYFTSGPASFKLSWTMRLIRR